MNAYDTYRLALKNGTANPVKKEKKKIPKMSARLKDVTKEYTKIRKAYLSKNLRCRALVECKGSISEDVHHMKGRIGKLLTDEANFLPVCRKCHRWIHDHHGEAKQMGLILSSNIQRKSLLS